VRGSLLQVDKLCKGGTGGEAFEPPCLIVEPLQRSKLLLAAEPGLRNRGLQHPDCLIVNREGDWKGMPVLAAMSEGKPRRVSKPVGGAMDDLGDHSQRVHRAGADTRAQQEFGKILRAGICRRGQRRVQPPEIDVARAHIVMRWHDQMRQ
jgi:hypothetical protein